MLVKPQSAIVRIMEISMVLTQLQLAEYMVMTETRHK